jgi:hypothetical protein
MRIVVVVARGRVAAVGATPKTLLPGKVARRSAVVRWQAASLVAKPQR